MNFIWKIFHDKIDESVHRQFIRFGKGVYGRRALLSLWRTANSAKMKSSFEFANDFTIVAAEMGHAIFNGNIWSKQEIPGLQGKKKEGKIIYEVQNMNSEEIKKIAPHVYYFLLNAEGPGIKLKIKPKLPKPGKGENKIDDKFCQLEVDEKHYHAVKQDLFWDLPDCKKASVEHRLIINDIILPKTNEKDYAKLREMAKKKGRIIRTSDCDGKKIVSERDFEA